MAAANSNGFVFLKDKGGDENSQIYYYRNADRSTRLLTDGKSLNGGPVWAHDGKRLAFHSNARDGVSYDIYLVDVDANAPPRLLTAGKQGHLVPARLVAGRHQAAACSDTCRSTRATSSLRT